MTKAAALGQGIPGSDRAVAEEIERTTRRRNQPPASWLDQTVSIADLIRRPQPAETDWGPWHYDEAHLTLQLAMDDFYYEIDLEWCRTSAEVLDWIFQIQNKHYGRTQPEVMASLLRALEYLLHPQANLCSMGVERGPVEWLPRKAERVTA